MLKIMSLGWGVQSWTMAAMVALGDLPPIDFAIHADTTWEHESTYQFAAQWTPWLKSCGIKVITVSQPNQTKKVTTAQSDIPAYVLHQDGKHGQLRRQCTQRWKIHAIHQFIMQEMKRRMMKKTPGIVETWLGITTDEWRRVRNSDVKYITNVYPLLDMKMSRADCLAWLEEHNLSSPGKSACVFCPYQSKSRWQELKRAGGTDWETALTIDAALRDRRPPYRLYIHPSRLPLSDAVSIPEDFGAKQASFFDFDEPEETCADAHCFL